MRIGFKIILDKKITVVTLEGLEEGVTNEIAVEINEFATPYEEIMQDFYNCPEQAYYWKERIQCAADKIVRDFARINHISNLHKESIKFYIIQEDEYTNYIVNFYRSDCTIQRVVYDMIDIDREN